jgi:hypothetical protein
MGHQLGDHRVVVRRDLVARAQRMLHPQVGGHLPAQQTPALRHEVVARVFGAQPHLDGMAAEGDLVLRQRQWLTRGHTQLPVDQVEPGDGLGHRVLHLQTGVHLHEEEVTAAVEQEFQRASPFIADGLHGLDGHGTHARAQVGVDGR